MAHPGRGISRKKGKKNRKWKRNKSFCERYFREGRQERNRKRRILRHLKRFPNDYAARAALD